MQMIDRFWRFFLTGPMSTTSDWLRQNKYERGFEVKGIETDQQQPLGKEFIDTEAEVRRRAYELYEERGRLDGFEVADWLTAETEILNRPKLENSKLETSKLDEAKFDRPKLDRPKTNRAA